MAGKKLKKTNNPLVMEVELTPVKVIVDADTFVFKAAHAAFTGRGGSGVARDNGLFEEEAMDNSTDPLIVFDSMIRDNESKIKMRLMDMGMKPTEFVYYYTVNNRYAKCKGMAPNFRFALYPEYKAKRKSMDMTTLEALPAIYEHATSKPNAIICEGCEADDVVAYEAKKKGTIMAALDKDLLYQVAGKHINTYDYKWINTDPQDAMRFLYYQALKGDPTDNYKGIPGVGDVGAWKILSGCVTPRECWKACLAAYKERGMKKKELLVMLRLASMHQWTGKKIKLYKKPKK